MKAYTALFLAASASLLNAQHPGDDLETAQYIQEVCLPNNATGYPDLNAPCNAIQAILAECTFGPSYLAHVLSENASSNSANSDYTDGLDDDDDTYPMQNNATQRTCICESQWFELTNACSACYQKHGLDPEDDFGAKQVSSISSAYCAATATPTLGFALFIYQYAPGVTGTSQPASSTARPSSFSDPLGNRTEVSLYYTPSVTGSAAWAIAEATGTSSGLATFTTTRISNGQIIATATNGGGSNGAATGAANAASSTSRNANSTTTAPNSAHTHGVAAAAGLMGVAGLLAML